MGYESSQVWDAKDEVLSSTNNAQDLETTTLYDAQGNATDTYGPAPSSCFGSDRTPVAGCAVTPAHTHTDFDNGLNGLNAVLYSNETESGQPTAFDFGIQNVAGLLGVGVGGTIDENWASGKPYGLPSSDNWSLRANGSINLATAGTYTFKIIADDGSKLTVDNQIVIDASVGRSSRTR